MGARQSLYGIRQVSDNTAFNRVIADKEQQMVDDPATVLDTAAEVRQQAEAWMAAALRFDIEAACSYLAPGFTMVT